MHKRRGAGASLAAAWWPGISVLPGPLRPGCPPVRLPGSQAPSAQQAVDQLAGAQQHLAKNNRGKDGGHHRLPPHLLRLQRRSSQLAGRIDPHPHRAASGDTWWRGNGAGAPRPVWGGPPGPDQRLVSAVAVGGGGGQHDGRNLVPGFLLGVGGAGAEIIGKLPGSGRGQRGPPRKATASAPTTAPSSRSRVRRNGLRSGHSPRTTRVARAATTASRRPILAFPSPPQSAAALSPAKSRYSQPAGTFAPEGCRQRPGGSHPFAGRMPQAQRRSR